MLADGIGTAEILAEHPDLTAEDIHESLLYAARPYASENCRSEACVLCRARPG
jgi:uncharacterized protein (DUF433 family)